MDSRHISTHSLTKRLTESSKHVVYDKEISTHSLTKRLTILRSVMRRSRIHFNSQPHEEADPTIRQSIAANPISTHSLTKRLTGCPKGGMGYWNNFNSQPHEEADGKNIGELRTGSFQLTASRRG